LAFDLDRLHPARYLAVQFDFDVTDALQIHPLGLGQPAGTVTVLGPLHAAEPGLALEPGIARLDARLGRVDPPKESSKRLIESAQRGLLARKRPHRHIRAYLPDLGQLRRLVPVVNTGLTVRPGIPAFLQRGVVKLTVGFHARRQGDVLTCARAQPEHVCASHDAITASHWCSM